MPLILVCPGTGLSPCRALVQERPGVTWAVGSCSCWCFWRRRGTNSWWHVNLFQLDFRKVFRPSSFRNVMQKGFGMIWICFFHFESSISNLVFLLAICKRFVLAVCCYFSRLVEKSQPSQDLIFLGFRHQDGDFLYGSEWSSFEAWLSVHVAFSRDHEDKKAATCHHTAFSLLGLFVFFCFAEVR